MSPEAREIIARWVHEAMYEVSAAHDQPESRYCNECRDNRGTANAERVGDLVRRIEIVANEAQCDLDTVHVDAVWVNDANAVDGTRPLTQRETLDVVKAQATSAVEEAAALTDLRAAKAKLKSIRTAKQKGTSVQPAQLRVRTTASVQIAEPDVRTDGTTT